MFSLTGSCLSEAFSSVGAASRAGSHGSPPPRLVPADRAIAIQRQIAREREGKVHGLASGGAERAPFGGQGGDQYQPPAGVRAGWLVRARRQETRRVVDVNAQLTAGAPDGQRDGLAVAVDDGAGDQVAGEQDRDSVTAGDLPRPQGRGNRAGGLAAADGCLASRTRRWYSSVG